MEWNELPKCNGIQVSQLIYIQHIVTISLGNGLIVVGKKGPFATKNSVSVSFTFSLKANNDVLKVKSTS